VFLEVIVAKGCGFPPHMCARKWPRGVVEVFEDFEPYLNGTLPRSRHLVAPAYLALRFGL